MTCSGIRQLRIKRLKRLDKKIWAKELYLGSEWEAKRMDIIRDKLLFNEPLTLAQSKLLYVHQKKYTKVEVVRYRNAKRLAKLQHKKGTEADNIGE